MLSYMLYDYTEHVKYAIKQGTYNNFITDSFYLLFYNNEISNAKWFKSKLKAKSYINKYLSLPKNEHNFVVVKIYYSNKH